MKTSASFVSAVLLVLAFQFVICLSTGYVLDTNVIDNALSGDESDVDHTNIIIEEFGLPNKKKRAQLSLTGGLRSLAHMVYGQRNSERSTYQNALLSLGKRNWRLPVYNFGSRLSSNILGPSSPSSSSIARRRSQQLSVSGPLSVLANMLAAEGRRRKQSESLNNRMKLLEIGKRNMNSAHSGDINEDIPNNHYL